MTNIPSWIGTAISVLLVALIIAASARERLVPA